MALPGYLHKKFKKLASVDVEERSVSSSQDVRETLKHSVGSMVAPASSPQAQLHVPADGDRRRHSRHTAERPYYCESCKFSFKTKNNLFKHRKCRSHILRVEKGIESSPTEILAELGDTAGEELDLVTPVILSSEPRQRVAGSDHYNLYSPDPAHHPARHHQPGLVLLPSHLVKPGPGPRYSPYHLSYPASASHPPPLRFIEQPGQPLSLLNGHHIVHQPGEHPRDHLRDPREHPRDHPRDHRDHPREHPRELPPPPDSFPGLHHSPGLVRQKSEKIDSAGHHAASSLYPQSYPFPGHPGTRDVVRLVERVQYREPLGPADLQTKKPQQQQPPAGPPAPAPHINAESLEQRINKVISENQAIVETLDPFWKGRYMRQSSREEINSKERSRRFSQSSNSTPATAINTQATASPHSEEVSSQNSADRYRPSHPNSFRESNPNLPSSLSVNYISNNVPPPPRPDSNIPLNLSDTGRKRKSPENPLIDAHSVKEVWLNSQKKTGNISHLEDIASSIEAKLRSSENPFHPDNPEGSIIKDLLLKTRQGHIILASSSRESDGKDRDADKRGDSPDSNTPINLQMSPGSKAVAGDVGIPVPKNFLPSSKSSGPVETSLYQCNLCMVTFKSLESIEIHQSHYCKNSRHTSDMIRAGPGDRRKSETGSSLGEPPVKRSRSDSLPVPANVTVSGASLGLLQIAASKPLTTVSNIPGIPTPNLSGVLTGIKSQPLFSLPGVRASSSVLGESTSKPVYTMSSTTQEDKPVTFVLGIPGPYSQAGPRPSVMAPTNMSGLKIDTSGSHSGLTLDDNFVKPPVSLTTLTSPARDRAAHHRLPVNSGQQRKYDFLPRLESPHRPEEMALTSLTSPPAKPDRPNSLALPPGALFKKKDVAISGATLISPETPRPKKAYQLHYQNGTAYTFLGLKCSTRVFFCSIHKPQPNYVQLEKNSRVSMYSNWKVVSKDSHPSGLSAKVGMSAYNSFNQHCTSYGSFTMAAPKKSLMITTHSSRWHEKKTTCHTNVSSHSLEDKKSSAEEVDSSKPVRTVEGGFKSADDNYTYIRGRGRGKYICDTCGIRCKKPSMLKKHIRTHTNVRPFTCKYCNFSFKTKGNLTKHMKSKAHSKKCVELGIVPVPTTAEDQQMDDSKSSGEIAMAGDSDTDDGDDADDLDEDDDDEQNTEDQFDDASAGSSKVNTSGGSEDENSNAMLGLAPRAPRFSMLTLSSGSSTPVSNPAGPPSPGPNMIVAVSKISEHEQLTRNTRLATVELDNNDNNKRGREEVMDVSQPRKEFQIDTGPIPCGSKIWSIAKLTDNPGLNIPRPGFLEVQKQPQDLSGSSVGFRHQAADILSPVTESATILSYIDKTSCKVMRLSDQVVTTDTGLKNYLQERAAIRAKQNSVSYESNDLVSSAGTGSVVVKEEPSSEPAKSQSCVEFPHTAYSHTDTIPQNVTMNVKDMPPIVPTSAPQPPPEFSIPHISKADSPLRASKAGGQENMRIKTPDSINQSSVQSASRSTESPASNSSQDNESASGASGASKTDSSSSSSTEKGSVISNPQEIFQVNEDGKSVCGICKKIFSKPSQLRLHVNIHYFERPFRCESCAVSFRTKGHLQKHKRSVGHFNKVNINATFGTPSQDNPRPFKCGDCVIAFRIHGHLAKHLRSKMHIMKLECIGKLPIGMYAEMERLGTNLNEIDTTDCENSLESLQQIAVKLYEKDPSKLTSMDEPLPNVSTSSDLSDEEDSNLAGPDIKEEPVEIVPNITAGVRGSPSMRPAEAGQRLGDRQSYSSGQEDPSTDSDTETSHSLKCPQCPQVLADMKSLQIHSFVEHHGPEHRPVPAQSQVLNLSGVRQARGPSPADQPVSCHICGLKLPNQTIFQQHLQTHAVFRPYICQLCDAGFTSPAQLETHSKLHQ